MNIDINLIDSLVAIEKKRLEADRERLNSARSLLSTCDSNEQNKNTSNKNKKTNVGRVEIMLNNSNEGSNNENEQITSNQHYLQRMQSNDLNNVQNNVVGFDEGKARSTSLSKGSEISYDIFTHNATDNELDEASSHMPIVPELNLDFKNMYLDDYSDIIGKSELSKRAKNLVNQHAASSAKENIGSQESSTPNEKKSKKNQDDMEQWVSDTFYSYFPSYNNEYQKRQNYLRERQQENQQNFLKHQQQSKPSTSKSQQKKQSVSMAPQNLNTTRSSSTSTTDKTDLEILALNNPDYVPPKYNNNNNNNNARPATNRHRLLQDLRHTDLSNMLTNNGVVERNRRNAESILAGKQNYQRELMLQIEEKRRNIELFRERERLQEESLTRRLEEQLKTIQLEEQLEKEKMRQDRILFDNAQSRILREHLLAKLEQDTKLLKSSKNLTATTSNKNQNNYNNNDDEINNNIGNINRNRVYQYFSNSARHEYRRGQPLPAEVELDVEIPERVPELNVMQHGERECFHLSEHVCPQCDAPLRMFKSSCLRCQRKLSMKTKVHRKAETQQPPATSQAQCNGKINGNISEKITTNDNLNESVSKQSNQEPKAANDNGGSAENVNKASDSMDTDADDVIVEDVRTYSLVCTNCELLYAMCPTCLSESDVCRACHRKRNVCLNCRRTLCSFCLEEIASGRDMEHTHINEPNIHKFRARAPYTQEQTKNAFQVLEVNYQTTEESEECAPAPQTKPEYRKTTPLQAASAYGHNLADNHVLNNKLPQDKAASRERLADQPPFSMHIERNSIFHEDHAPKASNMHDQLPAVAEITRMLPIVDDSDEQAVEMERLHRETERRMSRYMKNYGDLAQRQISRSKSESRSTQTTPISAGRRDVVLHEENNLSMPLLREMPRMTRREARRSQPPLQAPQQPSRALQHSQSNIENLKRRWEVPAVQKFSITTKSPRVLTQVGAIRQQLQAACLFDDETDQAEDN